MRSQVILVRHGATAWNQGGQWQGWTDNPLGELGREQARVLRAELAGLNFSAVYSSDLLRARQTAELAVPGAEVQLDARLRELHLGDYEGLTLEQMQTRPDFAAWQADPWARAVPGGESLRDVARRMSAWLSEIPAGRVIAFSHSIAIRSLTREVLGLPLEPQPNYPVPYAERIGNGQFVVLEGESGGWRRGTLTP